MPGQAGKPVGAATREPFSRSLRAPTAEGNRTVYQCERGSLLHITAGLSSLPSERTGRLSLAATVLNLCGALAVGGWLLLAPGVLVGLSVIRSGAPLGRRRVCAREHRHPPVPRPPFHLLEIRWRSGWPSSQRGVFVTASDQRHSHPHCTRRQRASSPAAGRPSPDAGRPSPPVAHAWRRERAGGVAEPGMAGSAVSPVDPNRPGDPHRFVARARPGSPSGPLTLAAMSPRLDSRVEARTPGRRPVPAGLTCSRRGGSTRLTARQGRLRTGRPSAGSRCRTWRSRRPAGRREPRQLTGSGTDHS